MEAAVMVLGLAAEAGAWWLVARRRLSVWVATTPVLVAMGLAALALGPSWSPGVERASALGAGVGAGVILYVGTWAFVTIVRGWEPFRRHTVWIYGQRDPLSLGGALGLSVGLGVPGEELFWRGLFQPELASALGGRTALAATIAWAAFVAVNLPSANLAIVAGAVVGGAVWSALGWWSGGVLAPLACHVVWTALMISRPVIRTSAGEAIA